MLLLYRIEWQNQAIRPRIHGLLKKASQTLPEGRACGLQQLITDTVPLALMHLQQSV